MIYLLSLSISPQDKWRLHEPLKEEPGGPEEHERELTQLSPEVWVEDNPSLPSRLAKHQAPVIIELKPGTIQVRKCQYPLLIEARARILPHINRLEQAGGHSSRVPIGLEYDNPASQKGRRTGL